MDKISRSDYVTVVAAAGKGVKDIKIAVPDSVAVNADVTFVAFPVDESEDADWTEETE